MTTRKYARLTGASTATAQRDLAALAHHGCLRAVGHGRSVRYELVRDLSRRS
jgi:DeoR/GlpR family transcriptional regulator of sugar metabolism